MSGIQWIYDASTYNQYSLMYKQGFCLATTCRNAGCTLKHNASNTDSHRVMDERSAARRVIIHVFVHLSREVDPSLLGRYPWAKHMRDMFVAASPDGTSDIFADGSVLSSIQKMTSVLQHVLANSNERYETLCNCALDWEYQAVQKDADFHSLAVELENCASSLPWDPFWISDTSPVSRSQAEQAEIERTFLFSSMRSGIIENCCTFLAEHVCSYTRYHRVHPIVALVRQQMQYL